MKYRNDKDRCYGAAGMAIGLVVYDGEEMLQQISVDREADEMVALSQSFYFSGNPTLSAKTAWNMMLRNFNLLSAMTIANVMCRCQVLDGKGVDDERRRQLHDVISAEAAETCSLENDEAERLFDKNYNYLNRIFSHRGVQGIAHDLAGRLEEHRTMSGSEIIEALRALAML